MGHHCIHDHEAFDLLGYLLLIFRVTIIVNIKMIKIMI